MKYLRYVSCAIFCCAVAYYLTWCVDKITLVTLLQKFFVFIYFFFVTTLLNWLGGRYLKARFTNIKSSILCVCCSALLAVAVLVISFDFFIGRYGPMTLEVTALGNSGTTHTDQNGTEVWITKIVLDGAAYDLSKIPLPQGWEYRDLAIVSLQNQPNTISITLPAAENIELDFLSFSWSGETIIQNSNESRKIDLYQANDQGKTITSTFTGIKRVFSFFDGIAVLGCVIMLTGILNIFISFCKTNKFKDIH